MNERNRWFFAATVRSLSRYSCSVSAGGGSARGLLRRMFCRQRRVNQRVERTDADDTQHVGALLLIRADVPLFERIRRIDWHVARYFTSSAYSIIIKQVFDFGRVAELYVVEPGAWGLCSTSSGFDVTSGLTATTFPT